MNGHRFTIRPISQADLDAVADIHRAAFPSSALTKLGPRVVRRYYEWQLNGPHDCHAIVLISSDQETVGFCFGGSFNGSLIGFLRRNRLSLLRAVIENVALLSDPLFRDRLFAGVTLMLRKIGKHRRPQPQPTSTHSFGILSVAVAPDFQGSGAGRRLMEAAETEALQRGFSEMHLTVGLSNERAVWFYEKQGWRKEPASNWQGRMVKNLQESSMPVPGTQCDSRT